jgi:prepilin-type N-terminal cleavage/methylation domain-containing protein
MRGFTLIELLVVMAIIAVLVIIAVPNYNAYNRVQRLNDGAAQLQSAIRNAQNNALTGTACSADTSSGKWSVNFTTDGTQFKILVTCRNDGTGPVPTPVAVTTYTLPTDIVLDSITLSSGSNSCSDLETPTDYSDSNPLLDFKAISGDVDFGKFNCTNKDIMTIILRNISDTSKMINVIVEKGGGVYVQKP